MSWCRTKAAHVCVSIAQHMLMVAPEHRKHLKLAEHSKLRCVVLQAMKDPHPYVRDTTAWTIGRVFEFQHDASDANIPELITRETLPQVAPVRTRT
jgi:hypothetical protein